MKYTDGSIVSLGDIVTLPLHDGDHEGTVVILGDTFAHLDLEPSFVKWVQEDEVIDSRSIGIRLLGANPLEHSDSRFAPVGDIIFTELDEDIRKIRNEN